MAASVECVQVVVRCRPLNQKEIDKGCKKVVSINESTGEIIIGNNNDDNKYKKQQLSQFPTKMFTFDKTFGEKLAVCIHSHQCSKIITLFLVLGLNKMIFMIKLPKDWLIL